MGRIIYPFFYSRSIRRYVLESAKGTLYGSAKKLSELPRYVHVSNSATALWHDETIGNMIRYGVAMYGLNPSGHALPEVYPLQPALELVSELIQVKNSQQVKESATGNIYHS